MYLFIILMVFILSGCSKKPQMTSFIPTKAPEEDADNLVGDAGQEDVQEEANVTVTPKPVVVGQTTAMYVKLDEYGGFLNIRPTPSKESAPVGFLVHAEKIDVIEVVDGWASFLYKDAICYVNSDFLVNERPEYLEKPTPTPTPVVTPTTKPDKTPTPVQETTSPDI